MRGDRRPAPRSRRPHLSVLASSLLLLATAGSAAAQISLEQGTRVRIRPVESRASYTGVIASFSRDTLVLDLDRQGEPLRTFTLVQVDRIELSQGRRNVILPGAFFGALAAGLAAMTYNHLDTFSCSSAACDDEPDLNTAAFAALGALAGGILGGLVKKERWLRISLPAGRTP